MLSIHNAIPLGGRYLLLTSCVRRKRNNLVSRLSSVDRSLPSVTSSLVAEGWREARIGCSYTLWKAVDVPSKEKPGNETKTYSLTNINIYNTVYVL